MTVTATEPDAAMLDELRRHVPATVTPVRAKFEELPLDQTYGLVYAAASLHWTDPAQRWSRMSALVEPGGVFASFGGPFLLADAAVDEAVRAARAPFMETDDVATPEDAAGDQAMQWPGTELQESAWFTDVQQTLVERRLTISRRDYVGHLSTISAYLQLPDSDQQQVYDRITQAVPEQVEIAADITIHLARRRRWRPSSAARTSPGGGRQSPVAS